MPRLKTYPKVSIVIPAYNRQRIIKKTLLSAINQKYNNNFKLSFYVVTRAWQFSTPLDTSIQGP